ncbi:pirin family protein, partial [Streptomyces sp. P01-B04]|nr:pirin family protein [Streptomyces poriferorum]
GERTAVPDAPRVYVHVVRGGVALGDEELGVGDSARIAGEEGMELVAGGAPAELLMWELPD